MNKELKCIVCGEQVRTWQVENPEYPIYIDEYGIKRHERDNVLMCLNQNCTEHGLVHKYIKDIKISVKVEL